jgi:hypothetical protein
MYSQQSNTKICKRYKFNIVYKFSIEWGINERHISKACRRSIDTSPSSFDLGTIQASRNYVI